MKVALSHDWLNGMRGGEKCLEEIGELFPESSIFTLFYDESKVSDSIRKHTIFTSPVQSLPFLKNFYRYYLPFFPKAIESFDLSSYDLLISSSHCVAKGARKSSAAVHICYCFTPVRYAWELFDDYFGKMGRIKRKAIQLFLEKLKKWDKDSNARIDRFVAISKHIQNRIAKYYERESIVIYPPVDTDFFTPAAMKRGDEYLIVSALVPYKKIELAINCFNRSKKKLVIIGDGPLMPSLKQMAGSTVRFMGWQPDSVIRDYYRSSKALLFPGEEDFGIVPVEMQACGGAVIAYRKGGATETVLEGKTGIFFDNQNVESLEEAISRFENQNWQEAEARKNSENFSAARFRKEISAFVKTVLDEKRLKQ